ncbi:MAG: transglutaminase-like domain-containing protein [Deltaproteobacteria bacterium]|nr:transglutaminase-like domain-containing protein [Kofleriaceae bacterium]
MVTDVDVIRVELQRVLALSPSRLDLVALAIARLDDDPFDDDEALATLDEWGESVRRAAVGRSREATVEVLAAMLGGKLGLRGDTDQYDDPENSFLPRVLERRLGLPILLSIVYIEVGRRAGVPLFGLALPGHFVVAYRRPQRNAGQIVLDPFRSGRELSDADVEEIGFRSSAPITPDMFGPATPYTIATRTLRNLLGSYQRRKRWQKARTVAQLMQAIDPDDDALN